MVFGFWLTGGVGGTHRIIISFGLFVTFLFKMLMGYEYLTSIVLFSTSLAFFKMVQHFNKKEEFYKYLRIFLLICLISVLAFLFSLIIQANYKADDLLTGLKLILTDAQKRTFGNAVDFPPVFAESLNSSYAKVLKLYFIDRWSTDIYPGISSKLFPCLVLISFFLIFFYAIKNSKILKVFIFYCYLLLIPLSWLILAKPHSFIHTHINFVLFYIGFLPGLACVILLLIRRLMEGVLRQ